MLLVYYFICYFLCCYHGVTLIVVSRGTRYPVILGAGFVYPPAQAGRSGDGLGHRPAAVVARRTGRKRERRSELIFKLYIK